MGWLDSIFGSSSEPPQTTKPTGLLSGLDPQTIGLLSAASAGLMASGPSTRPVSFGQVMGNMIHGGLMGYTSAEDGRIKREEHQELSNYRKAQIGKLNREAESSKEMDAFFKSRFLGTPGTMPATDMGASVDALGQGAKFGDIGPTVTNAARMDAMRPPQVQGQNGFPLNLNDVAYLKTKGVDLADVYKLATEPFKMEGGSTYVDRGTGQRQYMPKLDNGFTLNADGSASVVPGYAQGSAAIKGAETQAQEAIKANFDLLPLGYVGQDGRPIGGTRGAYVNGFNQPQTPSFAPTQRPGMASTSPANFPRVSPEVQRGRDSEAYQIIKAEYDADPNPQNRAMYERELAKFQRGGAVPGAAGGPPVLQSEAERQQQVGAVTGRQGTQNDLNKNWITSSYNPILEAGRSASAITSSLDALKNINLQTGWGTEAKAHAASVLSGLGIAPQNAKLFAANAEKFQSVAMDRLLTTLAAQKGPQTEGDAARAQQAFAQLRNTPEANQFISDFARAKANADARRAQFYQEALPLAQQTGDLNEIDRRWAKIQGSIWADPILQRYVRSK